MGREYHVRSKPLQVVNRTVFGELFKLSEYTNVVIATPCGRGNVAFLIDKNKHPRWKDSIPFCLPTPFSRHNQAGIKICRIGENDGLVFPEDEEVSHQMIVHHGTLRFVIDFNDPEIARLDWVLLPPDVSFHFPIGKGPEKLKDNEINKFEPRRNERLTYLSMLQPTRWWHGKALKEGVGKEYYVAEFEEEDLIFADCPLVANALFVLNRTSCIEKYRVTWKDALRSGKYSIRNDFGGRRVVHRGSWWKKILQELNRDQD